MNNVGMNCKNIMDYVGILVLILLWIVFEMNNITLNNDSYE